VTPKATQAHYLVQKALQISLSILSNLKLTKKYFSFFAMNSNEVRVSMSMRRPSQWLWTLMLLAVPIVAVFWIFPEGFGLPLVDGRGYADSLDKWADGADVYVFRNGFNFLYPPVFLYAGGFLARILTPSVGWLVFLLLHIAAGVSLPFVLSRFYLGTREVSLPRFYWLYFAAPGLVGICALKWGNIATICYVLMLLAGVPGLRRNQWAAFYICVFLCSSVKITFLPMLLLPLFCGRKQWLGTIGCGLACIAGLYSQKFLMPELYARFQNSLHLQAEDMGDVGKSVFGVIFHLLHKLHHENLMLALAGHAAVAIVVLALLVYLRRRGYDQKLQEWPALILAGILFITPRANLYDLCVVVPLVYGAAISIVRIPRARLVYLCLFVISLPPIIYARDTILNGALGSLTALGLFFAIAFKLSKLPAPEALQSQARLQALQGSSIHG
jgi:hypothetical protein